MVLKARDTGVGILQNADREGRTLDFTRHKMNPGLIITLVIFGGVVCGEVLSCDSCGRECTAACGTRQFRACCFNYLRKRGSAPELGPQVDPGLRLELWLARTGALGPALEALGGPQALGPMGAQALGLRGRSYLKAAPQEEDYDSRTAK